METNMQGEFTLATQASKYRMNFLQNCMWWNNVLLVHVERVEREAVQVEHSTEKH